LEGLWKVPFQINPGIKGYSGFQGWIYWIIKVRPDFGEGFLRNLIQGNGTTIEALEAFGLARDR